MAIISTPKKPVVNLLASWITVHPQIGLLSRFPDLYQKSYSRGGLKQGDRIFAVNGQSIVGENHKKVIIKPSHVLYFN